MVRNLLKMSVAALVGAVFVPAVQAVPIGFDSLAYPDGAIGGQTGGTGWAYTRADNGQGGTKSGWENLFGTTNISAGKLVTQDSGALRKYNANEGDTGGAVQANGVIYFGVDQTPAIQNITSTNTWSGASSYDFGTERIFFGIPGGQAGDKFFGIDEGGVGTSFSTQAAVPGQTYRLVAAVDFDNDQLKLWINPDKSDFDNGTTSSADVVRPYTGTNWTTALRLASGPDNTTQWDNVAVATSFAQVVPEPATASLVAVGGLLLAGRRRQASR